LKKKRVIFWKKQKEKCVGKTFENQENVTKNYQLLEKL
jgi:hypothetical protein